MAVEIEAIAVDDIDRDLQPTGLDRVRFKDGLAGARKTDGWKVCHNWQALTHSNG